MYFARYKKSRFWGVYDPTGSLICLCVYKKGAQEVLRRMEIATGKENDNNGIVSIATGQHPADRGSRRRTGASGTDAGTTARSA